MANYYSLHSFTWPRFPIKCDRKKLYLLVSTHFLIDQMISSDR